MGRAQVGNSEIDTNDKHACIKLLCLNRMCKCTLLTTGSEGPAMSVMAIRVGGSSAQGKGSQGAP